jgi:predicted enzyme related to lactoylglutathione lyase
VTEMTRYDHGVPSWVDLGTSDPKEALRFYQGLFGWQAEDMGEQSGHYTIVSIDGKQVAAISPAQQDQGPPRWTTYVNVDDAAATAQKVEAAGGRTLAAPMDVMEQGRLAVFADVTGAVIAVWEPAQHIGAQLINAPGALTWNELATSDLARSRVFYSDVFGWSWTESDVYSEAKIGDSHVAGAMPRPPMLPAGLPDHWLVYFGAGDVDADSKRAVDLGATLLAGPQDIPDGGRFAVLADPQGAAFALFQAREG